MRGRKVKLRTFSCMYCGKRAEHIGIESRHFCPVAKRVVKFREGSAGGVREPFGVAVPSRVREAHGED